MCNLKDEVTILYCGYVDYEIKRHKESLEKLAKKKDWIVVDIIWWIQFNSLEFASLCVEMIGHGGADRSTPIKEIRKTDYHRNEDGRLTTYEEKPWCKQ